MAQCLIIMISKLLTQFILVLLCTYTSFAGNYSGNRILEILGEPKIGEATSAFRTEYLLDKILKNPEFGVKLSATRDENPVITALTLTNAGFEINEIPFKQYKGAMPFGLTWEDTEETLTAKLGSPKANSEEKVKFKKDGISIFVFFKNAAHKKITHYKFSQNITAIGPYRIDGNHDVVNAKTAEATPTKNDGTKDVALDTKNSTANRISNARNAANAATAAAVATKPATFGATVSAAATMKSKSPFYNAIMNVFESGEDELFKDMKRGSFGQANFWNYKHTYATNISIPGEKYNMLYSFPFATSQLDFVSVLEETEGGSMVDLQAKYVEIENKLKEDFKLNEGWVYNYIPNHDNPKGPKDFELKNSKLGSVVLDHSINPQGKQVLYLRFLLQYD